MSANGKDATVIVGAARTAIGGFQGGLAPLSAVQLGSAAIGAALEKAGLAARDVSEVLMGCVLPAGQGQAPARQAARGAGLPDAVGATTSNKVCGSGMKATMLAHDLILAGSTDVVVAGGMESMSNAPYLLPKARAGYRAGHDRIFDGYPDVALELVDHRTFDGRLQLLEYVPTVLDGPPGAGE